jgi:hypothetical protein
MANKPWSGVEGDGAISDGPARASNSRTTGRTTPVDAAADFVKGSQVAVPGPIADYLGDRSDLFDNGYNFTTSDGYGA